jgi:hypothetical protein
MPIPRSSWRVNKTGALSGLEKVSDEIEAPGPGEARIKVRAIGLNFADVFSVLGGVVGEASNLFFGKMYGINQQQKKAHNQGRIHVHVLETKRRDNPSK